MTAVFVRSSFGTEIAVVYSMGTCIEKYTATVVIYYISGVTE